MTQRSPAPSGAVWTPDDLAASPHDATDKARRVQTMFAGIARAYDLNNRVHSLGRDQAWRRRAVRLATLKPTDDVLDVACGTGDLTELLAAAGPASVIGVDFTDAMLDIAREKASRRSRRGDGPEPEYRSGDAMSLAFGDASVDVVTIAFGIRNVAEPARAIAEFRRVLRPGGRLVILEFSEPSNPILRAGCNLYTRRIMPLTATLLSGDRTGAYRYLPRSVQTFLDREEMVRAMEAGGFGDVTQHTMSLGICVGYRGLVRSQEEAGARPAA